MNPIDVRMSEGYGRELLAARRCAEKAGFGSGEWPPRPPHPIQLLAAISKATAPPQQSAGNFPLVLGRDCCGEVVETGREVRDFNRGDQAS